MTDSVRILSWAQQPTQVSSLVTDSTVVRLESFTLNVDIGELALTFTDIINFSTFNASVITIRDNRTANVQLYTDGVQHHQLNL